MDHGPEFLEKRAKERVGTAEAAGGRTISSNSARFRLVRLFRPMRRGTSVKSRLRVAAVTAVCRVSNVVLTLCGSPAGSEPGRPAEEPAPGNLHHEHHAAAREADPGVH